MRIGLNMSFPASMTIYWHFLMGSVYLQAEEHVASFLSAGWNGMMTVAMCDAASAEDCSAILGHQTPGTKPAFWLTHLFLSVHNDSNEI